MSIGRIIQTTANIATIAATVVLIAVVATEYRAHPRNPERRTPSAYQPGEAIETIDGLNVGNGKAAVLIVLRSGCQFCTESLPFYKTLTLHRVGTFDAIALAPEPKGIADRYLKDAGVEVDRTIEITSTQLTRVRATPTLIVLDSSGRVVKSWVGHLNQAGEDEVVRTLRSLARS